MKIDSFNDWKIEKEIHQKLVKFLHEGCLMVSLDHAINEGTVSKADFELDRLMKKSTEKGETPIIKEFVPEIKALIAKFADSGQSGGSAPYAAGAITQAIKKLLMQEPLGGIENTPDEWTDTSCFSDVKPKTFFQNKRLSSVFKEGLNGTPYFLDAIVFKGGNDHTFTSGGSVTTRDGEPISSSQYIKQFPFEPKTFVIDVIETEWEKKEDGSLIEKPGGGWWTSVVKDDKQLEEVWNYYNKKTNTQPVDENELFELFRQETMPPSGRKSLDELHKHFNSDQEIIDTIQLLGLELVNPSKGSRTAEYIFKSGDDKWISYDSGYVRYNSGKHKSWMGTETVTKTPINDYPLESSTDRLLFILRRAMKLKDIYWEWKKSGMSVKDFLHKIRGSMQGKQFGI